MSTGCQGGEINYDLKVDTSKAQTNIAELNRLFTTYLSLVRRVGLPENIMDAMSKIQQLRIMIQTATTAINILYTATGPVGWAIGLGGLAVSGFMWVDWVEAESRGR
jgi:hypothetical protein